MNRCITGLVILALLFAGRFPSAQGAEEDLSIEEQMAKLVELGSGVHKIQKNSKGLITSCVVVGQARISTALGKAKGLELARDKANIVCSAEFVKWLKEEVRVYQFNDEETVILLEGNEKGDADSLKESGKAVEKSSKQMESVSSGLVRGLHLLHKKVDASGKTYTVIRGWKADTADGTKKLAISLASDKPEAKDDKSKPPSGEDKEKKPKEGKIDKEIQSGSATSDDAHEFLPMRKKK